MKNDPLQKLLVNEEEIILDYTKRIISLEKERNKLNERINFFRRERDKLSLASQKQPSTT